MMIQNRYPLILCFRILFLSEIFDTASWSVPVGHTHRQKSRPRKTARAMNMTGGMIQYIPDNHQRFVIHETSAVRELPDGTALEAQNGRGPPKRRNTADARSTALTNHRRILETFAFKAGLEWLPAILRRLPACGYSSVLCR